MEEKRKSRFEMSEAAKEKLAAIFKHAPWLETDGKAVHMPITGLGKNHQLTWPELCALYDEGEFLHAAATRIR